MSTIIVLAIIIFILYKLYKRFFKSSTAVAETKPERVYTEEEKAQAQKDFLKVEKYYKSFKEGDEPLSDYVACIGKMITAGELKSASGKVVTESYLENLITFREITDKCFEEGLNPRSKEDREAAEAFLDLENDEDYEYDYEEEYDYSSGSSSSRSSKPKQEYGSYVIQYRSGSTWIDGPGSNDERVAESMFDRFLESDPRGSKRCRLVYKVNGRVQSVLSTN